LSSSDGAFHLKKSGGSKVKTDSEGYFISKRYSWYIFTLLYLLYLSDYIDRMVVVSLFPYLQVEWGLSDTQCGMLVSVVYWSIVAFTFPISILIDRWSRKKSIGIMALIWSFATGACVLVKTFPQLIAARTVIGVGEAGYAPGGTAMISAFFPEKKRSLTLGLFHTAVPVGNALGIALGGFIAATYGWRSAFGIVAIPGFILALLFFTIRDYKTIDLLKTVGSTADTGEKRKMKKMDIAREFAGNATLITTYIAFAANIFFVVSLLSWLPTYFYRIEGIPMEQASVKAGIVFLFAIIGAPLGGFIADRWAKKRVNGKLLTCSLASLVTSLIILTVFLLPSGPVQYAVLLMGGVAAMSFTPAAVAVTQEVVHPGLRAMSYSLCVIFQNLLGSSLGPIFVGALSDRFGIKTALTVVPAFAFLSSIIFFIASFFYEKDIARVEKVALSLEE